MILVIETSAEPASVALLNTEGEVLERVFPNENKVNIPLADEIHCLLEDVESLEAVLVGAGPGSYSGARVGLATAEGVGLFHECPVVTIPSFWGIAGASSESSCLVGDARRGAYFMILGEHSDALVLEKEAFLEAVHDQTGKTLMTFEGADKLPIEGEITKVHSSARVMAKKWFQLKDEEKTVFLEKKKEVIYLRPPNITKAKNPFA